jgi:hypothetical protein
MDWDVVNSTFESYDWSNHENLDRANGGDPSADCDYLLNTVHRIIDTYYTGARVHDIFPHEGCSSNVSYIVALTTGRHFVLVGFDPRFYVTPDDIRELFANDPTTFGHLYSALKVIIPDMQGTVAIPIITFNPDSGYWSINTTLKVDLDLGTTPNDNRYYDLVPVSYIFGSDFVSSTVPACANIIKIMPDADKKNAVWRSKFMGRNDGHEVVRHIGDYVPVDNPTENHLNDVLGLVHYGAWNRLRAAVTDSINAAAVNHPTI